MKFRVSTASERLVGKLDGGEDLVEVLTQVCDKQGIEAGQVYAVGHFDSVELVHFDSEKKSYETVVDGEGSFDLVSLQGNVSRLGDEVALRLVAVFVAVGPAGPQMVGGQLRRARAIDGEFVVQSHADLQMKRRLDPQSGRLILDAIERRAGSGASPPAAAPQPEEDDQPSMSWDDAIAQTDEVDERRSQRRSGAGQASGTASGAKAKKTTADPYEGLDLDEPLIAKGDLLDHPKLGRCRVLEVEDDQYMRIRLPRGRIRKLALQVLEIVYEGEDDGKSLFKARVRS